jgi:hypothetical protein
VIRLVPKSDPTIGEAIQRASIGEVARLAAERRIREEFWRGFWWGAAIFAAIGIWAGYLYGGTP